MIDILPEPFEWISIPGGNVTLEEGGYVPEGGQTFSVEKFQIAKYPITNAQYGKYVEATGKKPVFGDDTDFNQLLQSVINVTWHDAIAYCNWLSKQVGYSVMLPTEQQWQRAAQGDDGRTYPWGNEFDKSKANTFESGIKKTTPVTQYPSGASPYGVMDMSGNVWEWCLNDWDTGAIVPRLDANWRVLRGGSFRFSADSLCSAYRVGYFPSHYGNSYGFRCVLSVPIR